MILREYRMKFEKVNEGEQAIDPEELGSRSKLGGLPTWDQSEETPICESCKKPMTFVAQIDSIEHDTNANPHRIHCLSGEQHFMFADAGMIYVFFCIDCSTTKSIIQCS